MRTDTSLRLEVTDFQDPRHWRWLLRDAGGAFLADHSVALDATTPEYAGFLDLDAYLDRYAAPDKWPEDHARLVDEIGAWVGAHVLGPVGDAILRHGTPATVRVILPPQAESLLYRPLEIAHAKGKPLALQDVSLVLEVTEETAAVVHAPTGDRLRVLAIFSLPSGASALALRRERYELERLLHSIAEEHGLAIELQVLQYGVTRARLQEVLEDGEGWDVIHFSGHGEEGALVLEQADGGLDGVTTGDLCALLRRARGRVKLVTLAACLSAAASIAETRRWLGLAPRAGTVENPAVRGGQPAISAVARAVVRELDCAVLAMRFPVGDDFAIGLAARLYERLLERKQQLPRALQLALPATLGHRPHPGVPPLSVATPALFGRSAVDLELRPPRTVAPSFALARAGMAHFPPEPTRFVGRSKPMAQACAAIHRTSGRSGILLHGMAGGGKTACALELAYRYRRDRFGGFVWYQAPEEGKGVETALRDFAVAMETQLPGFAMVHVVDQETALNAWLPRLTQVLKDRSLLLVLDNLESLLDEDGHWRDPRWAKLIQALLVPAGPSRTVLTSRRVPTGLDSDRVLIEPIHALSLDESLVLARESPNLGRLLRGEGLSLARGRDLVLRTLLVVQGHPKLIELAEAQAADPGRLARHLDRASSLWAGDGGSLGAFFATGETALEADAFLRALAGWTDAVSASLPEPSRLLFWFLCALEQDDRNTFVLEASWSDLWRHLERAGEAPDVEATLAPVLAAGLAEARQPRAADEGSAFVYRVHPGVAEAGRRAAGGTLQEAVDQEVSATFLGVASRARQEETEGGSTVIVHAGLHAVPYLVRLQRWTAIATALGDVLHRKRDPATAGAVLPLLRHIASATAGTAGALQNAALLARALLLHGSVREAEGLMRQAIGDAEKQEDLITAAVVAGDLVNLLRRSGRPHEALTALELRKEYHCRAGTGPWTQLADEGQRIQILVVLGECEHALGIARRLRNRMRDLPEQGDRSEYVFPWNVREAILGIGGEAAGRLHRADEALSFITAAVASKEARNAPASEVAAARFNGYSPLLGLGRHEEARALLQCCRGVFEREKDIAQLGMVFTALAELEGALGNHRRAVSHQRTALRYDYAAPDAPTGVVGCAIDHHNLANYLRASAGPAHTVLAHLLAAALILRQAESGRLPDTLAALTVCLSGHDPGQAPLPRSFDDLCIIVEQVEGVRFRDLFERLPRTHATGDEALQAVLSLARQPLQAREAQDARPADRPPATPT